MTVEISRFGPDGPVGGVEGTDLQWWKLGDDEAAVAVTATLKLLQQSQRARLDEYELSMRLYGGGLPTANARRQAAPAQKETASFNIVWSALSTAEAMLARNKPKAMFLTSGGNYHQRRKAKKLNRFVDGVFYECKANERRREARRDGLVFGDGPTKVLEGPDGRVRFERVLPEELFIDDLEGIYGQPRQMHHVKVVDRNELREIFKDRASVLKGNGGAVLDVDGIKARVSDMVTVRESWHLPSAPGAKDGKHIITIDGHALTAMEEWPHPFFPFARWRWAPRLKGFWSQGAAEQLRNLQIEIQKIDRTIARSIQLAGSFKVLLPIGSDIPQEHINNAIGTVVKHRPGFEPKYITPPIVQPEIYERRRELIRDAFNQIGISQMNATAQKPPGIDSGKGLRTLSDINSDRFRTVGEADEEYTLELARLAIVTAKEIAKRNKGQYPVRVPGARAVLDIDWKDIDLADDAYIMQGFPVSSLPSDPAGRLETIQEYMQAGLISQRQGMRLLDFPDLEQVDSLQTAEEELLTKILDAIVDEGEYTAPEPFDDLALARELALQYYAEGRAHGLEDERLELLRRFMAQLDSIESQAAAKAAMPAPGAPLAAPTPPPRSDLIPNAPPIH